MHARLNLHANIQVTIGFASMLVGLLLVFAPSTELFLLYNETIALAFWGTDTLSPQALEMNHWLLATCGAGVLGWGIAWACIGHIPFRAGERWAWLCLAGSLLVWSGLDILIALWFGVTGELLFVCSFLGAAGLALGCAWPAFRGTADVG